MKIGDLVIWDNGLYRERRTICSFWNKNKRYQRNIKGITEVGLISYFKPEAFKNGIQFREKSIRYVPITEIKPTIPKKSEIFIFAL